MSLPPHGQAPMTPSLTNYVTICELSAAQSAITSKNKTIQLQKRKPYLKR